MDTGENTHKMELQRLRIWLLLKKTSSGRRTVSDEKEEHTNGEPGFHFRDQLTLL